MKPVPTPESHALLGASSAHRWLNCPPSARLCEQLPDTDSPYAAEGGAAHALAALELQQAFGTPLTKRAYTAERKKILKAAADAADALAAQPAGEAPSDLQSAVTEYVDLVKDAAARYASAPFVAIEQRVDYAHVAPEGYGTCDCLLIGQCEDGVWEARVVDYKHGKGVAVSAVENEQLLLYALGALRLYGMIYPIARVMLTICQPRIHNTADWTLDTAALLERGEAIKPTAQLAFVGGGEQMEGDWCRFCKLGATCRARANVYTALEDFGYCVPGEPPAPGAPAQTLTDDEVGGVLRIGERLSKWLDKLREYAMAQLLAGHAIAGWKLVDGRPKRVFADVEQAFELAKQNGVAEEMLYTREPVTPTALEKLMGKRAFCAAIGPALAVQPGKPTLAPATDRRAEYKGTDAATDFGDETEIPRF